MTNLLRNLLPLMLVLAASLNFGCSVQKAAAPDAKTTSAGLVDSDPEAATALKLIDKAPESPAGYNALAIHYLKKVRQTADFGYASKAETAVDRALTVNAADMTARKLK